MPLPFLGLAGLLLNAAPAIAGLFGDEDSAASKIAGVAGQVGRSITGHGNEADAVAALQADPELLADFIKQASEEAIALAGEETKQLRIVNETMRREAASNDKFVSRWRPFFGYAVAVAWIVTFFAIAWAIVATPKDAPEIIAAVISTAPIWGIALGVLGISVVKRSHDKQIGAASIPDPSRFAKAVDAVKASFQVASKPT